jgi:hypothetical protein
MAKKSEKKLEKKVAKKKSKAKFPEAIYIWIAEDTPMDPYLMAAPDIDDICCDDRTLIGIYKLDQVGVFRSDKFITEE